MIYLDNAATSFPKAPGLAQAMVEHITNVAGNTGRSSYSGSVHNSMLIYETRDKLAQLLNSNDSSRFIFTKNATEALSIAILGSIKMGDNILISPLEHNSVMRPLSYLQVTKKINIHTFKLDDDMQVDMDDLIHQLNTNKINKVISTLTSNVSGTILPLEKINNICKKFSIDLIVDASQYVGYAPLDLTSLDAKAICFPGHKGLLGPSGTGVLWLGKDFQPHPLTFGGTGSKSESINQPDFLPDKYESGTPNITGICGLSTALDYLLDQGLANIRKKRVDVYTYLLDQITGIEEILIHGNQEIERQIGLLSFNIKDVPCSQVTYLLDRKNIAVRMGLHCAPQAHKFLETYKLGGSVRISPSSFTSKEEIDITIKTLKEIIYGFKR